MRPLPLPGPLLGSASRGPEPGCVAGWGGGGGGRGLSPPVSCKGHSPGLGRLGTGARGDLGRRGTAQASRMAEVSPAASVWGPAPPGGGGHGKHPMNACGPQGALLHHTRRPPAVTARGHAGPSADRAQPRFFDVQPQSRAASGMQLNLSLNTSSQGLCFIPPPRKSETLTIKVRTGFWGDSRPNQKDRFPPRHPGTPSVPWVHLRALTSQRDGQARRPASVTQSRGVSPGGWGRLYGRASREALGHLLHRGDSVAPKRGSPRLSSATVP